MNTFFIQTLSQLQLQKEHTLIKNKLQSDHRMSDQDARG